MYYHYHVYGKSLIHTAVMYRWKCLYSLYCFVKLASVNETHLYKKKESAECILNIGLYIPSGSTNIRHILYLCSFLS